MSLLQLLLPVEHQLHLGLRHVVPLLLGSLLLRFQGFGFANPFLVIPILGPVVVSRALPLRHLYSNKEHRYKINNYQFKPHFHNLHSNGSGCLGSRIGLYGIVVAAFECQPVVDKTIRT